MQLKPRCRRRCVYQVQILAEPCQHCRIGLERYDAIRGGLEQRKQGVLSVSGSDVDHGPGTARQTLNPGMQLALEEAHVELRLRCEVESIWIPRARTGEDGSLSQPARARRASSRSEAPARMMPP